MPLEHSRSEPAFKRNVKTLMKERGVSPHVKDSSQALAIAYAIKRRGRAAGGPAPAPWQVRSEARSMVHTGPINSIVPGRTDNHRMAVPGGAYVVNADTVSHLGQNNSMAGNAILSHMFGLTGPYGIGHDMPVRHGIGAPRMSVPKPAKFAAGGSDVGGAGGSQSAGQPVEVATAGGEFVIHPLVVKNIGHGDINFGHQILDHWMKKQREDHIKVLKSLPGPAKS